MVIPSLYFVEHLCQFRILPLTARFASFTLAFDLALCSSLPLEPFVAGQAGYSLLDLAFGLVNDLGPCLPPLVHDTPLPLLPQDLLYLTDLFLHFAGYFFGFAFGLQLGIIGHFPGDLLDLTLHFVKRSFRLVPNTRFHGIPPGSLRLMYKMRVNVRVFDCERNTIIPVFTIQQTITRVCRRTDNYFVGLLCISVSSFLLQGLDR